VTDFNLSKVKRINKEKDVRQATKERKKLKKRMQALKPVLNASISGSSFGMGLEGLGEINLEEDLLMDNDTVMDESSVDSKPQIIAQSPMEFPEKALKANIVNGMVELRLLINKEGEVGQTEILSAEPKGYFEEVALAGVQKWRFTPATYRGRNVAIWATQVVRFGE
jgi:protein TonB